LVAFYTVPAEVIGRLSLFPAAISKALFPRLSKGHHTAAADRRTGMLLTLACSALTILPVFALADVLLRLWMGPEYGAEPATVLRILLVGFFFNSLAFGPFTSLQARGHSKTTACIHAIEVLPYLAALILLTNAYGIVGTAIAWSLRTFVDYLLMEIYSRRLSDQDLAMTSKARINPHAWPAEALASVPECPVCHGPRRHRLHDGLVDDTFFADPAAMSSLRLGLPGPPAYACLRRGRVCKLLHP
jgi:peptidoglycan biosynthesis protein MviN/MurJ (putative lipid II flippase)